MFCSTFNELLEVSLRCTVFLLLWINKNIVSFSELGSDVTIRGAILKLSKYRNGNTPVLFCDWASLCAKNQPNRFDSSFYVIDPQTHTYTVHTDSTPFVYSLLVWWKIWHHISFQGNEKYWKYVDIFADVVKVFI